MSPEQFARLAEMNDLARVIREARERAAREQAEREQVSASGALDKAA